MSKKNNGLENAIAGNFNPGGTPENSLDPFRMTRSNTPSISIPTHDHHEGSKTFTELLRRRVAGRTAVVSAHPPLGDVVAKRTTAWRTQSQATSTQAEHLRIVSESNQPISRYHTPARSAKKAKNPANSPAHPEAESAAIWDQVSWRQRACVARSGLRFRIVSADGSGQTLNARAAA
ncbi:unnamed protein product [Tuwongella immobilis]|uniref:Uncharacterized protein n=1 Tax=Tuwongella immobilis TaxID=692036 RepID=A0A6C2YL28_9BACT|nr:unnamed protein product [Tuwongella immobilis]VTS00318.1 unnamed protein product [Tuwongella immobilis]